MKKFTEANNILFFSEVLRVLSMYLCICIM